MIKAILFDLDETLLDRSASVELFLQDQYHRYRLLPLAFEKYRARFMELDERGYADKQTVFQTLVADFGLPTSAEELTADFRQNAWKHCRTFSDTRDVLEKLRSRGYRLGIITNGSVEMQRAKLIESGLSSLVDVALISEQEKVKKPDPVIFARAAERLGVQAAECVFVGDNPTADVAGAHHAGMKAVWLRGYLTWPEDLAIAPSYIVTTLTELLAIDLEEPV